MKKFIKIFLRNIARNIKSKGGYVIPSFAGYTMIFVACLAKNPGEAPSVWLWVGCLLVLLAFKEVKLLATAILRFLLKMPLGITQAIIEEASDSIKSYAKSLKRFNVERLDVIEDVAVPLFSVRLKIRPTANIKAKGKYFWATLEKGSVRGETVFCVANSHSTVGLMTYNEVKDNFYFI